MYNYSFFKATLLIAIIPALLVTGACRKENYSVNIKGKVIEEWYRKPIPYATVLVLHSRDSDDPHFLVWKTLKADAEGNFSTAFYNRFNRPLRIRVQTNDSIVGNETIPVKNYPYDSIILTAERRYPALLHVKVRKNDLGQLHVDHKKFPKGPVDTILTFWGWLNGKSEKPITAFDKTAKYYRGQKVLLTFDSVYRAPIVVEIPDMMLQPKLN